MTDAARNIHIGVVTGLADLVNFLAVLQKRTGAFAKQSQPVLALLFGQPASLPDQLQSEFFQIARDAFPFMKTDLIPPQRVGIEAFDANGYAPDWRKTEKRRVVYTNGIHKAFHQSFYEWLKPDAVHFFDNGLSSYADHPIDIARSFAQAGIPVPTNAYLGLHPPLPVPHYLSFAEIHSLTIKDFKEVYACIRAAATSTPQSGFLPKHVIIGTSLFRTRKISWEDERNIYIRLIDKLRRDGCGDILYKAHPRASARPLISAADGVDVLDNAIPVEVYAAPDAAGVAYSISSTALLTLPAQFGWRALRIKNANAEKILENSPHLAMVRSVDAIDID